MKLELFAILGLASVFAAPVNGQDAKAEKATIRVEEGEMAVSELVGRWAAVTGRLSVLDPQTESIRIRFAEAGAIDPKTLMRILDFHDVVVTETGPLINVHHRRNLAQREGPPWRLVTEAKELAKLNEVVTWITKIKHGAGQQIFATVRGLLTRDTNRIGNILFVQGPDVMIIVDLADKVRYYREVIERLDVAPAAGRVELSVLELERAQWRTLSAAKKGAALVAALRAEADAGRASVLEEASLPVVGGRFNLERSLAMGKGEHMQLVVRCGAPQRMGKAGKMVVQQGSTELVLEVRLVMVQAGQELTRELSLPVSRATARDGTQILAFAGREGTTLVVIVRAQ